MVHRVISKCVRLMYKFFHPMLWNKAFEVNGIPVIRGFRFIEFGHHVSINGGVYIQGSGGVKIGDYVTLSRGVTILTVGLDTSNYSNLCMQPSRPHKLSSVEIGDGVWLASNCMVMPGVKIARGIIVGAGAVVTNNLDREGWLYGGIPARPIKALTVSDLN